ncbi:MAG: glycosyltransferase family 4 protein [Candidatus Omnitrophica bacterium]|nr:glycosyltransferase family 4 protein [Candidatus Omnitrophota bacterium]
MRVGIDAREIQNGVYTGIGRPLANFLHYFASLDNEDTCVLFSAQEIPIDFGPKVKKVVIPEKLTFYWDQWQLPEQLKKEGVEIFYSPYYKIPFLKPCRCVSSILDLMYLTFGPYYKRMPWWSKLYYATFGRAFAHRSDRVLTCSEYSQRDIQRIYGVKPEKIKLIPLSLGDIYRPESGASPVKGRYLLYVGNFKIHKNVINIIKAFALLENEFPDLKLVLAGPREYEYNALVAKVHDCHLDQKVIFLGKITQEDKPHLLYSGAEVFVMPSLYEGFGLPPLEAMACGVPVVASNTTSIPEVVKDAGLRVDPMDVKAIAEAIKRILKDHVLKQELIARGLRYAKEYEATKVSRMLYDFLKGLS